MSDTKQKKASKVKSSVHKRGRRPLRSPLSNFLSNLGDAELLLQLASSFRNSRSKRLRIEMRARLGKALRLQKAQWRNIDGLQSSDLFVVFLEPSRLDRHHLADLRPLLRPVVVATCAAFETYVADIAKRELSGLLRDPPNIPRRLRDVQMQVGDWLEIEQKYERRGWGIRMHLEEWLEREASASPLKVGQVFSAVGIKDWAKLVDRHRNVPPGTTVADLEEIAERRNRIAHSLDRSSALTHEQVERMIASIRGIVESIERMVNDRMVNDRTAQKQGATAVTL